jgi:hypothetical protein
MYFENFPKFAYDFDINGERKVLIVSDITRNVRFRKDILSNVTLYDEYDIKEGETPEIIAEKLYGNSEYHWIIMLVNGRYDYIKDFPLTYTALTQYITDKYGVGNGSDPHHYENSMGYIVNSTDPDAQPVSNTAYEEKLNEAKRRIKVISPQLLDKIVQQFGDVL